MNNVKPIEANRYDTDKSNHAPHLEYYATAFSPFCDLDVRLLELGVYNGGSL
jgi:hypothetical protein